MFKAAGAAAFARCGNAINAALAAAARQAAWAGSLDCALPDHHGHAQGTPAGIPNVSAVAIVIDTGSPNENGTIDTRLR